MNLSLCLICSRGHDKCCLLDLIISTIYYRKRWNSVQDLLLFHSNSFILSPLSNSVQSFPLALSFHLSILHPEALVWNLLKQESPAEPSLHISMPEPTFPDWKETLI